MSAGRLQDKSIVITGAASGLGRAMALTFAAEGADVVVGDVRPDPREGGEPTIDLIHRAGGNGTFVETDASKWDDIDRLVTAAVERRGRLDVMVNNAIVAGRHSKGLLETELEDWDAIMDVGLRGVFLCCKRAVQQMLGQQPVAEARGRIINISSQHGMLACPGDFPYSVSKGGIVQMTRQIAVDHADDLIICNAVAPGKIITGKPGVANDPDALDYSRRRTPLPRLGAPRDVAGAALFLASDMASYVTGINLMVDGGWMAG
jgi:glucose 1-dehydrogenase